MGNKKPTTVKLEMDLFFDILDFLKIHEDAKSPLYLSIQGRIVDKLGRMVTHDYYTHFKTAKSEEERAKYFNKYLDEMGMPAELRWGMVKAYLERQKAVDSDSTIENDNT